MEDKVLIKKSEYEVLKKKEKIADDALIQLKLSLEDIKNKRIIEF